MKLNFLNVPDTIQSLIEVLDSSEIDTFDLDNEEFSKTNSEHIPLPVLIVEVTGFAPYWFKINNQWNYRLGANKWCNTACSYNGN